MPRGVGLAHLLKKCASLGQALGTDAGIQVEEGTAAREPVSAFLRQADVDVGPFIARDIELEPDGYNLSSGIECFCTEFCRNRYRICHSNFPPKKFFSLSAFPKDVARGMLIKDKYIITYFT